MSRYSEAFAVISLILSPSALGFLWYSGVLENLTINQSLILFVPMGLLVILQWDTP